MITSSTFLLENNRWCNTKLRYKDDFYVLVLLIRYKMVTCFCHHCVHFNLQTSHTFKYFTFLSFIGIFYIYKVHCPCHQSVDFVYFNLLDSLLCVTCFNDSNICMTEKITLGLQYHKLVTTFTVFKHRNKDIIRKYKLTYRHFIRLSILHSIFYRHILYKVPTCYHSPANETFEPSNIFICKGYCYYTAVKLLKM